MKQQQQGDVMLELVDSLPDGAVEVKPGSEGYILAKGETTGHAHRITDVNTDVCKLYEKDGVLYVQALKPVTLTHEEHGHQTIEPGIRKVTIVKEKDMFSDMVRPVAD